MTEAATTAGSSELRLRIMSGLVLAALAIAATWVGGTAFRIFCLAIGATIFWEWSTITAGRTFARLRWTAAFLIAVVLVLLVVARPETAVFAALGVIVLVALAGVALDRSGWTAGGLAYALAAALPLALLRGNDAEGLFTILFLYAVVWGTDICAYFVGRALKGPKLAPAISPGKTWSGAIGGAACATIAGVTVGYFSGIIVDLSLVLLVLLLSIASQGGDLLESWIKRRCGVKDSSRIIPGHGGVMDRVDGLLAASLLLWLIGITVGSIAHPTGWLFSA